MAGTGFEFIDFITCCKFAEGDSRILAQKIARDHLRKGIKKPSPGEMRLIQELRGSKNPDYRLVYELVDLVVKETMEEVVGGAKM
jgi:hypothetical protein